MNTGYKAGEFTPYGTPVHYRTSCTNTVEQLEINFRVLKGQSGQKKKRTNDTTVVNMPYSDDSAGSVVRFPSLNTRETPN